MTPVDGALPVNIRNFAGTITCWLLRATGDSPGSFYSSTIPVWLYPLARCCGLCPQHGVIGEGNHDVFQLVGSFSQIEWGHFESARLLFGLPTGVGALWTRGAYFIKSSLIGVACSMSAVLR